MKPAMRIARSLRLLSIVSGIGLASAPALLAAAPSFTITATNLTLSGQGSGASQFTLTSVGGFAGTVGMSCSGPDANLLPDLVLPSCDHPVQLVAVPANGSASGTINFYPPWTDGYSAASLGARQKPLHSSPLLAGVFAGCALLGWRFRRRLHRPAALVVAAACLVSLAALAGCLGQGGVAMTPGTYTYTISGGSVSTNISVTVQCNSCP